MAAIYTDKLTNGVFWVEIKDADLRLLCGCPADSVKYLIRRKHIRSLNNAGVPTQIGPNALLLADTPLQNGFLSNLGEFPVMHMLYFQGISVPGHPNYGKKRVIIGTSGQIETQLNYMYVGNYGIVNKDLLDKICPSPEFASQLLDTKKRFAHGSFKDYKEFLRTCIIDSDVPAEIVPGVSIRRQSVNVFEIRYKEETCIVDMNLKPGQVYEPTYQLPEVNIPAGKFVIINTGLGDGWDPNRTCFSSMVRFDGRYYLVDVGPNIRYVMKSFGFAPEDIAGIIQTHIHDDHFGGYDFFWNSNQPVQIYSTAPVIASMRRKLSYMFCTDDAEIAKRFHFTEMSYEKEFLFGDLGVTPYNSPHPVETAIYMFRNHDGNPQKTYAHFGDLTSFKVLDMLFSDSNPKEAAFKSAVKSIYLMPADYKKIDIGGGLIHGSTIDFINDTSAVKVLGHISRNLTPEELKIGIVEPYGHAHVLIA